MSISFFLFFSPQLQDAVSTSLNIGCLCGHSKFVRDLVLMSCRPSIVSRATILQLVKTFLINYMTDHQVSQQSHLPSMQPASCRMMRLHSSLKARIHRPWAATRRSSSEQPGSSSCMNRGRAPFFRIRSLLESLAARRFSPESSSNIFVFYINLFISHGLQRITFHGAYLSVFSNLFYSGRN